MPDLVSPVQRWLGRRLLKGVAPERIDIARIPSMPEKLRLPFRRQGLDPVPELGDRRATEPVSKLARVFGHAVWVVTGHEAVRAVLIDAAGFSNDLRPLVGSQGDPASQQIGGLGMTDPPEHSRLRKILTPEFTKRRLARLEPRIAEIVDERLDALEAAGPVADLVPTFAFPVPFLVICELLGLSSEDRELFRELGPARFDLTQGGVGAFGAMSTSRELLLDAVATQRVEPGDGLIGQIIRELGDEVDDVELAGLADGVFLGGYETSVSMLSMGSLVLLQNREALRMLRGDDAAVDAVVEELLRYLTVVQTAFPRFARHDMVLFGATIRSGDVLLCSLSGANRDTVFGAEPERFDPHRPPGPHVAFGHGFHRCVGAELGRMELRAAFRSLAHRFPDMELAVDPGQLSFRELSVVYGVESLPVRVPARQPAHCGEKGHEAPGA
jgi:cytochrome P450